MLTLLGISDTEVVDDYEAFVSHYGEWNWNESVKNTAELGRC